jgi:hypothetical protein
MTVVEAHPTEGSSSAKAAATKAAEPASIEAAKATTAEAAKAAATKASEATTAKAAATKAATTAKASGKHFSRQQREEQCCGRHNHHNPPHGGVSSTGQNTQTSCLTSPGAGRTRAKPSFPNAMFPSPGFGAALRPSSHALKCLMPRIEQTRSLISINHYRREGYTGYRSCAFSVKILTSARVDGGRKRYGVA